MKLKVKRLNGRASIPKYAHEGDACFDIRVLIDDGECVPTFWADGEEWKYEVSKPRMNRIGSGGAIVSVPPGGMVVLHTGLAFEIEPGYVMKVHVRSSVGIKHGLSLSNGTGIIDSGYRGELHIALNNNGDDFVDICDLAKIAQAEICEVVPVEIEEALVLAESERGTGGIGSTGN